MIPILLNSDFSAAFLYLCVCRCREDNCILLSSFWLPTIVLLFLLIVFRLLLPGQVIMILSCYFSERKSKITQHQLRLPENMCLIGLFIKHARLYLLKMESRTKILKQKEFHKCMLMKSFLSVVSSRASAKISPVGGQVRIVQGQVNH